MRQHVSVPLVVIPPLIVGAAVGSGSYVLIVGLAVLVGAAVLALAPPRWLCSLALVATFLSTTALPVVADIGGSEIRATDLLIAFTCVTCLVRGRPAGKTSIGPLVASIIAVVLVSTRFDPALISFARMMMPLILALCVRRYLPAGFDVWRLVRWYAAATVVAGAATSGGSIRWSGIAGTPNEMGLYAAALFLIAFVEPGGKIRGRLVFLGLGVFGLVGAKSITAMLGLAGALLLHRRRRGTHRPAIPRAFLVAVAVPALVIGALALRTDFRATLDLHLEQASVADDALARVNPIIGGGWGAASEVASLDYVGAHNTYVDWLVNLGIIGLLLLAALLLRVCRSADRTTAAVGVLVAVWLNTSGAFPGSAWGLLGAAVLAASARRRLADPPELEVGPGEQRRRSRA